MPTGHRGSNPPQSFTCQYCGDEFQRRVKKSNGTYQFCSPACRNKARQLKPIPCPMCGNPFKPYKWIGEKAGVKIYCSRECADKAMIGRPSTNPDYVPQEIRKIIRELYPTTPVKELARILDMNPVTVRSVAYNEGVRYSPQIYRQLVHEAARAYMLRHNPSFRPRPYRIKHPNDRGPNWYKQRQRTLIRDGYRCQICNKRIGRYARDYGVHHIRPFREFAGDYVSANQLSNLITLCLRCHGRVERGKLACPIPLPI